MKSLEYIIQKTLSSIVEQAPAAAVAKETDNAPSDAENSPFTPAGKGVGYSSDPV